MKAPARLKREIQRVLRDHGPMGYYLGLEDRCNEWRKPDELRAALGELVMDGAVNVTAVPLRPHGAFLVYGVQA